METNCLLEVTAKAQIGLSQAEAMFSSLSGAEWLSAESMLAAEYPFPVLTLDPLTERAKAFGINKLFLA